jgi:hypothetical protein
MKQEGVAHYPTPRDPNIPAASTLSLYTKAVKKIVPEGPPDIPRFVDRVRWE